MSWILHSRVSMYIEGFHCIAEVNIPWQFITAKLKIIPKVLSVHVMWNAKSIRPHLLYPWCYYMQKAPEAERTGIEHMTAPVVGESYVAYFTAPSSPKPASSTDEIPCNQWFRVRVLGTVAYDCSLVKVLAIDFGFLATLACSMLCSLPDQCRGIPPQVRMIPYAENLFLQ